MMFSCYNSSHTEYYICGDSDWGDEEATVVCRKSGYLRGTAGKLYILLTDSQVYKI